MANIATATLDGERARVVSGGGEGWSATLDPDGLSITTGAGAAA